MERITACPAKYRARIRRLAPKAEAIKAVVACASPTEQERTIKNSGKENASAACASVEINPAKNVSVILNSVLKKSPIAAGNAIRRRCHETSPTVKSCEDACAADESSGIVIGFLIKSPTSRALSRRECRARFPSRRKFAEGRRRVRFSFASLPAPANESCWPDA